MKETRTTGVLEGLAAYLAFASGPGPEPYQGTGSGDASDSMSQAPPQTDPGRASRRVEVTSCLLRRR